jgi:hypothetical protein
MRRFLALVATALALASANGCRSDSTGPSASLAGTWNLNTINGSALPVTIQAAAPKIEVLNEQLIVAAGGTFTQTGNLRVTDAGQVTNVPYTDSGTWTINGTAATFRFNSDGSTGTGTISGNTFTVAGAGFSAVYVKQ